MKKNVASQVIGAQMVSATDGSAFTGSVTCYVTGDGGTQAVGSVSSGACTHEGNGFHTYAPAQAETNYDHIAFTFIGDGAVPVTVQVYTTFPQSGDAYAEVTNGTYGLSALEALVDGLESSLADGTNGLAAIKTAINTVDDLLDTEIAAIISALSTIDSLIDAIKAKTDNLTFTTANRVDSQVFGVENDAITGTALATSALDKLAQAGMLTTGTAQGGDTQSITLAANAPTTGIRDTQIYIPATGESNYITDVNYSSMECQVARPWETVPDSSTVYEIYPWGLGPTGIAAGVFARDMGANLDDLTFAELVALIAYVLLGKASGLGTTTATYRNLADTADGVVATVDADGNRSAVTRTP